jgi:hypothetical protein
MSKKTRALSGASQDAYFRRVLKAHPNLSAAERDQLLARLKAEIAQLRVRLEPRQASDAPAAAPVEVPAPTLPPPVAIAAEPLSALDEPAPAEPAPIIELPVAVSPEPFDPFSPNIVVVVRTQGCDAALAALDVIDSVDNLRLLAREQRLSVSADLASAAEMRAAIVGAAQRRIANRMAAAS